MWADVAQEIEEPIEPKSDDEDTVYDRSSEFRRNPFIDEMSSERRKMLEEGDTRCGLWNWKPEFLRKFVTPNVFIASFVLTGILNGASWSYFSASISTMEKRLKISSETTGALLASNELAQVIISLFLVYFPIRKRRMKFITIGVFLWAISCFLLTSHQLFFGSGNYALSMVKVDHGLISTNRSSELPKENTTSVEDQGNENLNYDGPDAYRNDEMTRIAQLCTRDVEFNASQHTCPYSESGSPFAASFVLVSQILLGIGNMMFLSSGGPYMDEVIMPDQLPVLFGISLSLRLIGPFLGYIFGFLFLQVFISTTSTPTILDTDPRWMGAYWGGWLVLGICLSVAGFIMALYPRQMAKNFLKQRSLTTDTGPAVLQLSPAAVPLNSAEMKVANTLPIAKDFMKTLLMFFNNDITLLSTLSVIFHIFVGIGYFTFFPLYLEVVFNEPSAQASMLTASATVTFSAAGLLVGGMTISRILPNAEKVSLWNVGITIIQILILLLVTQFGCDSGDLIVTPESDPFSFTDVPTTTLAYTASQTTTNSPPTSLDVLNNSTIINSTLLNSTFTSSTTEASKQNGKGIHILGNCSLSCHCELGPMVPLCDGATGGVFYSPCHAGCQRVEYNGSEILYSDCSCVEDESQLKVGFCEGHGCYNGLVTLMVLTAIGQFLGSSGVIGKMLIFYRALQPEGRSLIISVGILLISIFAIIPAPIIFGAVVDSACHIWEHTCAGTLGHCWHYSNKSLRYGFNLIAAGFLICAAIFDVLLWRKVKVKDVRLYDGVIEEIPKPSASENAFDDQPRARISSSAYS